MNKVGLAVFLLVVGCGGDEDTSPDAAPFVPTFKGRVCILKDLRDLMTCGNAGAGGLTIKLGDTSATTAEDGQFTLPRPNAPGISYVVAAGPSTVATSSSYVASTSSALPVVPAVDSDRLAQILAANAAPAGGAILIDAGRLGVTISSTPPSTPLYSGASLTVWNGTETGAGTVLIPGFSVADVDVIYTVGSTQSATYDVPVLSGGVTVVRANP